MNIQRKVVPVELEGKNYEFVLDFESAINFQSYYGKSIFVGLSEISKKDIFAVCCLIASCLKDEKTGKSVGMDFIEKIDLFEGLEFFMDKVGILMENSLPKEDTDKKK